MNSVKSNNLSLKYQRLTPAGGTDIRIRIFESVTKTQYLYQNFRPIEGENNWSLHFVNPEIMINVFSVKCFNCDSSLNKDNVEAVI